MKRTIKASQFKAECLQIMDEVSQKKMRFIITKRNEPVAQMIPIQEDDKILFGNMKGTIHIKGDLIEPIGEEWNAST